MEPVAMDTTMNTATATPQVSVMPRIRTHEHHRTIITSGKASTSSSLLQATLH